MKKNIVRIVSIAAVAVFATALTAMGADKYDLTGDNVDINAGASWIDYLNDTKWPSGSDYVRVGDSSDNPGTWTGYLDSTYDSSQSGVPSDQAPWTVWAGHLEFRNDANLSHGTYSQFQIRGRTADPADTTITVESGATLSSTGDLTIRDGAGSFIVKGGDVSYSNVSLGEDSNITDPVSLFAVEGSGGSITIDGTFNVANRLESRVDFTLDSAGSVTPINISTLDLGTGTLKIDTSAFQTSSGTVDLFNYDSLTGEFGAVEVLGSELREGNGSDPLTYNLDYGTNTLSMTYNNVPEPSSLVLLGIAGLLLMKRRRV